MNLTRNKIYWVEHPTHGTHRAELRLVSENKASLLFKLEHEICLPMGDGMFILDWLPLSKTPAGYVSLSGELWKIYENEPTVKLPTK